MIKNRFYRAGTQIALAALLGSTLSVIPAKAQGTAPQPAPQAQPGGRAGQMQARHLEMLTKRLDLTAEQQEQVKSIQQDTSQQMMALRNDNTLSQDQRRSRMMDIRKSSQDRIRAVLTEEQKPKFDAMQSKMRGRMRNRQHGQMPPQ